MTTTDATTYIANDGHSPELWRRTPGESTQDQLLLTRADVRYVLFCHTQPAVPPDADVDRLWDAIAATAGEAPGDDL